MIKTTLRSLAVLAALGTIMALPALAQQAPAGNALAPQAKPFPFNVSWTLVSMNGKPPGSDQPTLQLDSQSRMRGYAGCNTFSATAFPLKNQSMAVGPIAVTRKECDKGVMDAEKDYLIALRTARQWEVRDGNLYLRSERGELKFARALF